VGRELAHMAENLMPPTPAKLWDERHAIKRILAMKPRTKFFPPIKGNVIEPANLDKLPIAQSWPDDGGRFITFPLVVTRSPKDGKQNMGVYRMHVYNDHETGMHWQIGKGGGYHYLQAEEKTIPLPLSVAVGADPVLMMCGILPLPEGISELAFSGYLRGEATRTTSLTPGALDVPAEAEFILEGQVDPLERRMEGPYGDHFGHYSLAAPFPIFKIKRIWHRDNPVFPIAVVGKPPQEDQVIGDAVQEMLLPLLKIMHPEIVDLWAYQEAGFHNLLVISVKQRFAKEGIKTALWAFGEGQLALSKCIILVDEHVNARKFEDVLNAVHAQFDPREDFILLPATSQDTLDFTSFKMNLGSKMILDATSIPSSRTSQIVRPRIDIDQIKRMDSRITQIVLVADTLMLIQVQSSGREVLEKMLSLPSIQTVKIVAAVSPDVPLDNPVLRIWGLFTRFDCARDTFFSKIEMQGNQPLYYGPLFIDATWKKGYPDPLTMTDEVIKKVDNRWKEYGLEKFSF
jgi:4-hydroxy-3-polyprenylbenzoate decarboxylase